MSLSEIGINNFKSFGKAKIKLGMLNVIVGANSSGKTNFIQVFRFLKEYLKNGADNAISLLGGIENILNSKVTESHNILLNFKTNEKIVAKTKITNPDLLNKISINNDSFGKIDENKVYTFNLKNLRYEFNLKVLNKFKIQTNENLIGELSDQKDFVFGREFKFNRESFISGVYSGLKILGNEFPLNQFQFSKLKDQNYNHSSDNISYNIDLPLDNSFPEKENESFYSEFFNKNFVFGLYDFNTFLMKNSFSRQGNYFLDSDGGNISIILNKILSDDNDKTKFLNLLKYVLPYIKKLNVEDNNINYNTVLAESYDSNFKVSSQFFSDGVINIIAIIIALFFERNQSLIIIEEPDKNIHPKLMGKLSELIKDSAQTKQVIITTHNPELIKHFDFKDLILMKRNKKGFSDMIRPSEKKHLREFLDNEIGVDELFLHNFYED